MSSQNPIIRFKTQIFTLLRKNHLKIVSLLGLGLNIYCISYGLIHLFLSRLYFPISNFFGLLIILAWTFNLIFIIYRGFESQEYIIWKLSELYLYLSIFAPLLMILGNFIVSAAYFQITIFIFTILTYFSYFVLCLGGFLLFWYFRRILLGFKVRIRKQKLVNHYGKLRIFIYKTVMVFSGLYSLSVMSGSSNYAAGTLASSSQVSFSFFFTFAAIFIILMKINPKIKHYVLIFFIGWFTLSTAFLPLVSSQYLLDNAEKQFQISFGNDWRDKVIPANSYFLQQPYSLTEYFLGSPPKECYVERDILYYSGEGINLYFDVFMPKSNELPGNNSILITIHGGGWRSADKGFMNKRQVNRYLAAQGYVVFDVQYGLKGDPSFDPLTPNYVKGNFTLDDMVRHIGIFTDYLANNSELFGANLNSVFVTGGSSGGNLACAVGLGYVNSTISSVFNPALKIKGIIPYYPANNIAIPVLGLEGSPEINDPELLVNVNSPPCLLFHGTSDGIVTPVSSISLQRRYRENNNSRCALIQLFYGGHAFDYYYTGIFNQISIYYMERFLYLFH